MKWHFRSADAADALWERPRFTDFLRARCTPESDCDAAEIVFGELVANVVRHAPGPIDIMLEPNGRGALVLVVGDSGKGFAVDGSASPSPESEVGRGLHLVSSLCGHVACDRTRTGSRVSAELPCYPKRTLNAATSS
jgi:anti-sigma regulatory factor (Ser/Thr protein kinase)